MGRDVGFFHRYVSGPTNLVPVDVPQMVGQGVLDHREATKQRYTCEEHDPSRSRLEIAEDVNAIRVRTTPEEIFLELRSGHLATVLLHATRTRDPAKLMWPGTESNCRHADFQTVFGGSKSLTINHLQRLPAPSQGAPRHNHGTLNLSSARSRHSSSHHRGSIAGILLAYYNVIHGYHYTASPRRAGRGAGTAE